MKVIGTFDTSDYPWVRHWVQSNNSEDHYAWERVLAGLLTEDGDVLLVIPSGLRSLLDLDVRLDTQAQYEAAHPQASFGEGV